MIPDQGIVWGEDAIPQEAIPQEVISQEVISQEVIPQEAGLILLETGGTNKDKEGLFPTLWAQPRQRHIAKDFSINRTSLQKMCQMKNRSYEE